MTGRIPFGLLLSLTLLASWPIQAQDQVGPPPGYYGMQAAGTQTLQTDAGQFQVTPGYGYQRGPGPQFPGPPARMIYEQLPDDLGFTEPDTPLGNYLTETFRHGWFRSEYLLYSISAPGSALLGAQTSTGVPNLASAGNNGSGFIIVNASTTNNLNINGSSSTIPLAQGVQFFRTVNSVSGAAQTPTMDNTSIDGLSGFRGTFGLPLPAGTIELGGFVLGATASTFNGNNYIQPQIAANPASVIGSKVGTNGLPAVNFQPAMFISQALLVNGVAQPYSATSSSFLDYDVSYAYKYTATGWGSEVNYVGDSSDPGRLFQMKPIIGFRYFNYQDNLFQSGQYNQPNPTNPTAPPTVVTRSINSTTTNNLYGPQVGLRMEFAASGLALGFEPKLMMGLNTYNQNLNTSNVLSSTDPGQSVFQSTTTFSPMLDLKAYSSLALSQHVSAYLSYNFLYVADVNRSYNDVVYNKNGATGASDFILNKTMSNVTLQGISVGFDFRY